MYTFLQSTASFLQRVVVGPVIEINITVQIVPKPGQSGLIDIATVQPRDIVYKGRLGQEPDLT